MDDPDSESEPPDPRWDKLGLLSKQVYARILHNDMGNFTLSLLLCIFFTAITKGVSPIKRFCH